MSPLFFWIGEEIKAKVRKKGLLLEKCDEVRKEGVSLESCEELEYVRIRGLLHKNVALSRTLVGVYSVYSPKPYLFVYFSFY